MAKKRLEPKYRSKGTQVRVKGLAERLAAVEKTTIRADLIAFKPGDTIRVHVRIKEGEKERVQAFEGIVISRANKGASKAFIVRKMSHGVGVERLFLESSPKIAKVEMVQEGLVRRAKLYYLRDLEGRAARIERDLDVQEASASSKPAVTK